MASGKMMRRFLSFIGCCSLFAMSVSADTIERYMDVVDSIPKMEMKADPDAQIWVRSARNILNLTCESIAETLMAANKAATERGKPLFCLHAKKEGLDPGFLNTLIQKTYHGLSKPKEMKDIMTVSEVALIGLMQSYPCTASSEPEHASHAFSSFSHMSHVAG